MPSNPIKGIENLYKPINIVNIYHPPDGLLDNYNEFIKINVNHLNEIVEWSTCLIFKTSLI